jgi:hypothetical protein
VFSAVVPLLPPAISTLPVESSVAVCAWTVAGNAVVAVQVVVPFHSSALPIGAVPFDDPPATSSWPLPRIVVESSVAL